MPKNTFPGVTVHLSHPGKHGTDALAEKGQTNGLSLAPAPSSLWMAGDRRSKIPEKRFGKFGATVVKKNQY